jgi:CubicO group peptidase (beta-lactamase class C family)/multidrug transporter EmrE-like cation transporter
MGRVRPDEVLDELVARGQDPGGAVAVVRDGEVVVDHAAGTRAAAGAPFTTDTLVMTYSVAKPVAALAALSAVAEGHLELDTRLAEVWPAYAAHGKQDTTLRHVLCHASGVPSFPSAAADIAFDDREALVALLADAVPVHRPGEAVAEHALTYGHLLDEVVRRAGAGPLADRFARLAGGAGWDLHLVVPDGGLARVADVVVLDPATWPSSYLDDPRWGPALGRPAGLLDPTVLNGERWRRTSFPAIGLHATARSLASFCDDLLRPDGRVAGLLGEELWTAYRNPAASGHDLVLDRPVTWVPGRRGGAARRAGPPRGRHGWRGRVRGLGGAGRGRTRGLRSGVREPGPGLARAQHAGVGRRHRGVRVASAGSRAGSPDEGAVPGQRQDGREEAVVAWLVLVVSGAFEAVWAVALGRSEGFSRLVPSVVFVAALALSMGGLAWAMRTLPVGTSYAVWVGIGATATVAFGMATGEEAVSAVKVLLLLGLVGCIVGLKLVGS